MESQRAGAIPATPLSSPFPLCLLTRACLLSYQEHNWERWRHKLTLIQKSEVPAVISGATVGFQLGTGTQHEVASAAVVDHIAQWRERTRAEEAAAAAGRVDAPACSIASIDAVDDGR